MGSPDGYTQLLGSGIFKMLPKSSQAELKLLAKGFNSLKGRARKSFYANFASAACGLTIVCSSKMMPITFPKQMPKLPPAFENGVNYLHRWYEKTTPHKFRNLEKVD